MFIVENNDNGVVLNSENNRLRIVFVTEHIARITYAEGPGFSDRLSRIVTTKSSYTAFKISQCEKYIRLSTPALTLKVNRETGAISYFDRNDKLLVYEPGRGGKWLTRKKIFRNIFRKDAEVAFAQTIDD